MVYEEPDFSANSTEIMAIRELERSGVLGPELVPDEHYWHWAVLDTKKLPRWLRNNYQTYGEIRWHGW